MNASTKRPRGYRQRIRAARVTANTVRIIEATQRLAASRPLSEVTLDAVARASGTSVQTVLRRFASRDSLVASAFAAGDAVFEAGLAGAGAEDPAAAIRLLARQYERWGDVLMHLLGQERAEPLLEGPLSRGREEHRAWVRRVFEPALAGRKPRDRRRLFAQLLAVTDVTTWHELRRGTGLGPRETEEAMAEMALALLGG